MQVASTPTGGSVASLRSRFANNEPAKPPKRTQSCRINGLTQKSNWRKSEPIAEKSTYTIPTGSPKTDNIKEVVKSQRSQFFDSLKPERAVTPTDAARDFLISAIPSYKSSTEQIAPSKVVLRSSCNLQRSESDVTLASRRARSYTAPDPDTIVPGRPTTLVNESNKIHRTDSNRTAIPFSSSYNSNINHKKVSSPLVQRAAAQTTGLTSSQCNTPTSEKQPSAILFNIQPTSYTTTLPVQTATICINNKQPDPKGDNSTPSPVYRSTVTLTMSMATSNDKYGHITNMEELNNLVSTTENISSIIFFYSGTWPSYLAHLLRLRLVGMAGAIEII